MTTHSSADSKNRFSSRVQAYVAARPRYPREVIEHLRANIGLQPDWHVVDLGSGTGISCELFLKNGNAVTAVEPNAPMRLAAEQSLGGSANFISVEASAEHTTLPDACADLVVAAQAFHWFDPPAARLEISRILRPGGWAMLMWNDRKLTGTPFFEAYENLLITFGTDYLKVRHNNIADSEIAGFFAPRGYRSAAFPNHQHLDFAGLRSRLLSSSYVPQEGDEKFGPMVANLREVFDRYNVDGRVTIEYRTQIFYGQMR
jgi:SAM-dependent methyltransferase